MATGFRIQSESLPSACLVELPSNDQSGQSFNLPEKFRRISVLLLRLCVGSKPSNQIYSNFDALLLLISNTSGHSL